MFNQGIDASDNRNTTRIRVGARNGNSSVVADKAIADAIEDRFFTPLDFELLERRMPFYQSALEDRLEYELTFNDCSRVIQATGYVDASYYIGGISLEYDMVTLPELARMIDNQYTGRLAILYDRVLRHRKITMDKSNTLLNINLNVPARSMRGNLMLSQIPSKTSSGKKDSTKDAIRHHKRQPGEQLFPIQLATGWSNIKHLFLPIFVLIYNKHNDK